MEPWLSMYVLLCVPSVIEGRGVDLGMCPDGQIQCPCGDQSRAQHTNVGIKMCTYFHRYTMYCKACQPDNIHEVCARFRMCETCAESPDGGCLTCPADKYGRFCENECHCQNAGKCDAVGSCVCPPRYNGTLCELSLERCVRCPSPRTIAHGVIIMNNTINGVGSSIRYMCDKGFQIDGGSDVLTCLETGRWSGSEPWCERHTSSVGLTCSPPEPPVNGLIRNREYIRAFTEGVRIALGCDDGFMLVGDRDRTCGNDGNWTGKSPRCVQVITCDDPGIPSNAVREVVAPSRRNSRGSRLPDILRPRQFLLSLEDDRSDDFILPAGKFRVYTKLKYKCESQFYRQEGSRRRRCGRGGAWTGRQPACLPICGKSATARLPLIYNGTVSIIGQWPWQVAISRLLQDDYWYITCGGSLVTESLIVTAAHCVTHHQTDIRISADDVIIYLGQHNRSGNGDSSFVQKRKVTSIEIHPHYDLSSYDLDIAILWLDEPVILTHYVRPVCLPSQIVSERNLRPGAEGVVTGWGTTEITKNSEELRMTTVYTITNRDCMDKYAQVGYPQTITKNMFCAGHEDGSSDACEGDSGGPLVFPVDTDAGRTWYLEGIVSWGSPFGCGIELQYGVYTNVRQCMEWLSNIV